MAASVHSNYYNGDQWRIILESNYNNRDKWCSDMFMVTIIIVFGGGAAVNSNCNGNQWRNIYTHK